MVRKNAFTLIELSIVLIIIGLLVGGVLAGREIITQAELSSVLREIENYKVAINTYELKYGQLPGDHDNALAYWPSTCTDTVGRPCNGDGSGSINGKTEQLHAWEHMNLAGITNIPDDYINPLHNERVVGESLPVSPRKNGGYSIRNNAIRFCQSDPPIADDGTDDCEWPIVTATEARTMDLKVDDGMPTTGKVLGVDGIDGSTCVNTTPDPDEYDLSETDWGCYMPFYYR